MTGLCFLFGLILASLEGPNEIQSNRESFQNIYKRKVDAENIFPSVESVYKKCYEEYQSKFTLTESLLRFMEECTKEGVETQKKRFQSLVDEVALERAHGSSTFNWVSCDAASTEYEQKNSAINEWTNSYQDLKVLYLQQGLSEEKVHEKAVMEADGFSNCSFNVNAGAVFWYTVMTTIGYGNAAPVTNSGRWFVGIIGFFHLCIFVVITGHAGYIVLTILDDFFSQVGLTRLKEGTVAVVFWLAMFVLWLLLMALIWFNSFSEILYHLAQRLGTSDGFPEVLLSDGMWFAFVSITTIGFGDIYVDHSSASVTTPFICVVLFSIGSILFANFWLKLSKCIIDRIKSSQNTSLDEKMKSLRVSKMNR